jgi:glycosyltransferase involved in cell wall biosynthesis
VSEDSATFVKYGWPRHQPVILRPGVDPAVFHPGAARRQIAFSSRRRHRAARQVLGLLRARGALDGWALADIVGITQDQVAERLRESALFLSFSEREGLGLPPIEALASGCHVIGFTGIGGREIFDPRYTQAIAEDDIVAYAQAVERWLAGFDADAARQRGLEAASWVTARYSIADERSAVLDFYGRLLETPTVTGSTVVRAAETWGPHDRPRSNARIGLGQVRAGLRTMLGRF